MRYTRGGLAAVIFVFHGVASFAQTAPAPDTAKAACAVDEEEAKADVKNWRRLVRTGDLSFIRVLSEKYFSGKPGECAVRTFMIEMHQLHPEIIALTMEPVPATRPKGHVIFPLSADTSAYPTPVYAGFTGYDLNTWIFICTSVIEKLRDKSSTPEQASAEIKTYMDPLKQGSFVEEFRLRIAFERLPYTIELGPDHELAIKKFPNG